MSTIIKNKSSVFTLRISEAAKKSLSRVAKLDDRSEAYLGEQAINDFLEKRIAIENEIENSFQNFQDNGGYFIGAKEFENLINKKIKTGKWGKIPKGKLIKQ